MCSANLWVNVHNAIEQEMEVIVRSDFDDCAATTDTRFREDALVALSFLPDEMAIRIVDVIFETVEIGGHEGLPRFFEMFPSLIDEGYEYLKAGQVYELCCLQRRENTVLMEGFRAFTEAIGPLVWVTANHSRNLYANRHQLADETSVAREDMLRTGDKGEGSGPWDLSVSRFPGISICLENSRRNAEASRDRYPFFLLDVNAELVSFEHNIIVVPNWNQNPHELIAIAAAM
jgi:hypothetical protein